MTVTGRKTGKARTVPVIFLDHDDGQYIIAAAYSGSDTHPTWWLNLIANPEAVVEVAGATTRVRARLTNRTIPVIILTPVT